MIDQIADIINNHTYIVDEWLINRLDEEFNKGSYSSRENIDALALELTAKKLGKMQTLERCKNERYQWRHDWAYHDHLIDLKRKPAKWPNICLNDVPKMVESYNLNQLTHIVGYTQNIETDYEIGQILEFEFSGMLPLREAITLSERKGDTWRILNTNHLQREELTV